MYEYEMFRRASARATISTHCCTAYACVASIGAACVTEQLPR